MPCVTNFSLAYNSDEEIIYSSIQDEINLRLFVEHITDIDQTFGHLDFHFVISNFDVSKIRFDYSLVHLDLSEIRLKLSNTMKKYRFCCQALYSQTTDQHLLQAFSQLSKGISNYHVEVFANEVEAKQWLLSMKRELVE